MSYLDNRAGGKTHRLSDGRVSRSGEYSMIKAARRAWLD